MKVMRIIMAVQKYFRHFWLACLILSTAIVFPVVGNDCLSSSFCNTAETGSTMILSVANLNTQMGVRMTGNAGAGTGLYNNVIVGEYAPGMPSQGTVTAFIRGRSIGEGQIFEFNDVTSISGNITIFNKYMSYGSVISPSSSLFSF